LKNKRRKNKERLPEETRGRRSGFLLNFLPSQGRTKGGVSFILSPFQGETQKGFQLVETSPQPSPERRGGSISSPLRGVCISFSSPIRGGQRRGFRSSLPLSGGE